MNRKKSLLFVGILTLLSATVFSNTLLHGLAYAPTDGIAGVAMVSVPNTSYEAVASSKKIFLTYPAQLLIPAIHVNAKVQETGITKRGSMGTPTNYTDVAWYMYGTVPGQVGSAIIDGHVDNGLGLDGVFKHLTSVATGTDIYIVAQDGVNHHFVVTNIDTYDYKTAPVNKLFNEGIIARLRLITCGGDWVPSEKTYDKRLVVTAELRGE